ncbi:MAG: hypothetical protein KKB47_17260 [Alphaproteobacteria bacterium]|nr:hypothetical protein [Alphaproteobacteria bacterium]MBU1513863.1 hypothetical protein [Alphaproteobacteria bacterium]MBU2094492.1 hypothetical protein [Alphaproteobacteria bacterium]MBU2307253.1 hypothetical protein [Alphaproteobacteria bacterium]MBU2364606.1 hypothetical protein [Alphaproteobacteria bacterium]
MSDKPQATNLDTKATKVTKITKGAGAMRMWVEPLVGFVTLVAFVSDRRFAAMRAVG